MQQHALSKHHGSFLSRQFLVVGLWFVPAALGLTANVAQASELVAVSAPIPAKPTDKRLHDLVAAQKGHPVVINFWATWCEPCREEIPQLQRLANRWHDQGLAVLTVVVADNLKRVEDVLWEGSVSLPVIDDREQGISRSWGVRALPATVVLDRNHRIRFRVTGAIDWDSPAVDQRLRPLFN